MDSDKVARINELARKSRVEGLCDEEKEEQQALRAQYLKEFRNNMEDTLQRVRIQQPDGTHMPLKKKDK